MAEAFSSVQQRCSVITERYSESLRMVNHVASEITVMSDLFSTEDVLQK